MIVEQVSHPFGNLKPNLHARERSGSDRIKASMACLLRLRFLIARIQCGRVGVGSAGSG